jgi:hypothetical protein
MLFDFRAKRHKRQFGYFKALQSKRDADYRAAQQNTIYSGGQSQRDPADKQPDYVHDQ